ncbi:MAG: response regulator [Candidatus Omnitrophica bacterium]|nr:response regulator [Candidatus Omnitrophota bacterium]
MIEIFKRFDRKRNQPRLVVLVIDDNLGDLRLIENMLCKRKYQVFLAQNGETGLKLAREEVIHVILLDCVMPDMPGIDVCRRLKEDGATRHIPVIFLTVVEDGFNLLQCYDAGANSYLVKPVKAGVLISEIEKAFREKGEDPL